jgi:hypothetical protein
MPWPLLDVAMPEAKFRSGLAYDATPLRVIVATRKDPLYRAGSRSGWPTAPEPILVKRFAKTNPG